MTDTVSLEIAKRLKEAGWTQEDDGSAYHREFSTDLGGRTTITILNAPSMGDFLEALPKYHEERTLTLYPRMTANGIDWCASYAPRLRELDCLCASYGQTPADALALLWLSLKEKKLV